MVKNLKILIAIVVLMVGISIYKRTGYHAVNYGSIIGNRIIATDKGGLGSFIAEVGEPTEFYGHIFRIQTADGDFRHYGMHSGISYLDKTGYADYQTQFPKQKIDRCPATFLQSRTKTVRLVGATKEIGKQLMKIDFLSESENDIRVRFWGRPMKITEVLLNGGKRARSDPKGLDSSFLVERIISIR